MPDDMRKQLEDAFEEDENSSGEGGEETENLVEASAEEKQPDTTEVIDDEKSSEDDKGQQLPDEKNEISEKGEEKGAEQSADKAPFGWTPLAKEGWGKIPKSAQDHIIKREAQIADHLQKTSDIRKVAKSFNDTIQPYSQSMLAAGVKDPMQVVSMLFHNDNVLRNGSSQDKAKLVASFIDKFQIDINTLDGLLTGKASDPAPNTQMQDMIRQELAPMQTFMEQHNQGLQQQQVQAQQDGANSVAEFGKNAEFLGDVRNDMADLLDMAAKRNQSMTLQQAYDKACAINPEVSQVLTDRASERQLMGNNNNIQSKLNASSSVTGLRAGDGAAKKTGNMRDTISDAWDDAMS